MSIKNIENIIVIDVPTSEADTDFLQWAGEITPFFAETCGRQLLVCTKENYEKLPPEKRLHWEKNKGGDRRWVYGGYDGFERLLEVICGLHSNNPKDYNIFGQIKENWRTYCTAMQAAGQKPDNVLVNFCNGLFHDAKIIKSQLIDPVIEEESIYAILTQDLRLTGKETILIIADTMGPTKDSCLGLGKFNTKSAATIILTHFDEIERRGRNMEVIAEKSAKRIKAEIKTKPFADCLDDIIHADHVILCSPMCEDHVVAEVQNRHGGNINKYPPLMQVESTVMNAWMLRRDKYRKSRKGNSGMLVQVRGCPQLRNGTSQSWIDFKDILNDNSVITRSDLEEKLVARKKLNKSVSEIARNLIKEITSLRRGGKRITGLCLSIGEHGLIEATPYLGRQNSGQNHLTQ
ncbi:MAG TPA: hypothetical protein PKW15_04810 [Alphaproteobacteria bacterium]|nr:hypothetical protein [Rhodospirillaceae bacterium]HRJ12545.1 hypothetical protein [Alphaproteobacteria bacterium]